jgi:hypothetical protein
MSDNFDFSYLKEFVPEEDKGGGDYPNLKGTFDCKFNFCRVQDYDGDKPEFKGHKYYKHELEIISGDAEGRKLWRSADLGDPERVKKAIANEVHKLGLVFKPDSLTDIEAMCSGLSKCYIKVFAGEFKASDGSMGQYHKFLKEISPSEGDSTPGLI